MKMRLNRKIAVFMAFVMVIPLLLNMSVAVVMAATTPTLTKTSIELVGVGETYDLNINNKVAKSKYSWSSSNINIAQVNSKGLVTSVDKGIATVKCKITYPSKKTKTLSCKVTVTIPATDININNAPLENGAYVMNIGDTMDFNCELTPSNSSDVVFWSIGKEGDQSCIRIDNEKEGRITALKAGKVSLYATAAKTADAVAAKKSYVYASVIIEVVGPTATVNSADFTASNQITVVFDSPVNPSTVIGDKGVLSDNIKVSMSKDIKGVVADDPGKLTASISSDNKTLTILSEKPFRGDYIISFSSDILTMDGIHLESYYKRITYTDNTPPAYAGCTTDDTGRIATIHFSEPINFSKMKISGAAIVTSTGETASPTTISTLNNVLNYTVSDDKKSLTINLSNIPVQDFGKKFSVIISGITDLSGNPPAEAYIQAIIYTEINKPQARIVGPILRTGYNTVTVTFDRAIQFGGYLSIENGASITGIVDTRDNKKVNYTISPAEALYTGIKYVSIGFWKGYNVNPQDKSADVMTRYPVDFTPDVTSPLLITNAYDVATGILTLVYNEPVNITNPTGIFSSTYTSLAEDRIPDTNINYTTVVHTEGNNIVKLKLTGVSLTGSYRFTVIQGFVTDSFNNASVAKELIIINAGGESTELAPPYSISQNSDDLSIITVKFTNKLDTASAEAISNYRIPGVTIQSAVLKENQTNSATVLLTVADGSIKQSIDYLMTISGVKGFNNSYTEIIDYKYTLPLKENVKPTFVSPAVFETTAHTSIKLNFSEAIAGTMTFRVAQTVGATTMDIPVSAVTVNGSSVTITLSMPPYNNTPVFIYVLTNNITDVNGNRLISMPSPLYALVN